MKATNYTLIEQLKVTSREIERRKEYLFFTDEDVQVLVSLKEVVSENIEEIVEAFYERVIPFDEMDGVIGDAETLRRLKNYQRSYIKTLFAGQYDEEYVHSRLRVGVVHKRIGVEPKFYISAIHTLLTILREIITKNSSNDCQACVRNLRAVEKIIMFDLSLTFDTYINSLMEETKRSKRELEEYAESLEEVISERTKLLKEQARHDGLTKLLNQHAFYSELRRELARAQRRGYCTVLIYFDLDKFKALNDSEGHRRGDEVLVMVANSMKASLRDNELCARYGGDEFCIILPESTLKEAEKVCQRLCKELEKSLVGTGVSCSMGIAISDTANSHDADTLVKEADKAMYEAKKVGGFSLKIAEGF
ncbi:GGDEF domain-containing protein [Desulfotalea psychrophila]|uniref:Diguanylate cyclase DosC n=1 Tax=Desulfotalea psychrophila (strain LSv54 / DSM 12343) TaxID=177439 RepID=Q6ARU5_DESPS|nr:GGDEF domain-containing protein [Desulfotalea psychrophila]CAG34930.1 hypothetical protein DP0201 [Desulfotalea psychrophila LSv54]